LVEHQPSKLRVAGSSPVARFGAGNGVGGESGLRVEAGDVMPLARVAQLVEHILGKDEVTGSIPVASL
jgi:hypothetical protein